MESNTSSPKEISSGETNADVIQPISKETVHRICSGQVVLSLAIAVKELVENAIDASATNIEIRLKEYGSELVEVLDNGSGVHKENFAALTQKHWTSKIRQFSDLESVATLGFRGEALSSLCALADLTVTTKHSSAEHATKIQYDHNGRIIKESPTARPQGTTVSLENLFFTLPVRRKEFVKNLKREFNKMCQLLYAYCLVSKGIKFTCTNLTNKGSKNTVVSTQGLSTVRDNIVGVFGSKQTSTLIEMDLVEPEEELLEEYSIKRATGDPIPFKIECFLSSASHGSGRSTADRQFYFINSRPCEPTKVMKLVNEIYKQFNCNQYPFVYMNILTESNEIDVNVTPDKRQIFLEKEKMLLATIKASLLGAFKNSPSTFKVQNLDVSKQLEESINVSPRGLKRSLSEFSKSPTVPIIDGSSKKPKNDGDAKPEAKNTNQIKLMSLEHFNFKTSKPTRTEDKEELVCKLIKLDSMKTEFVETIEENDNPDTSENIKDASLAENESSSMELDDHTDKNETSNDVSYKITIADEAVPKEKNIKELRTSMEAIKNAIEKMRTQETKELETNIKFRCEIAPESNKSAEQELQKQITKDKFKEMSIIGQFNLGFIIAKLENDLFIIDQHASDEKYNFEQLQLTTTLDQQILVNAKPLQLTSANEELLIDSEDIFRKNGFSFKIDHDAEATKKVALTAIPISKNYAFGKDDIDEMLFMLQDGTKAMVRPSRVRAMFASRACRKSVMVGRSLSQSEMKRLVNHMGEIDQPWNCPHGRPTMRHLINLNLIQK